MTAPRRSDPPRRLEEELARGARWRLDRDRELSMSERLARVHELCLQLTAMGGGAAKRR
jgi:hypothetical protein